MQISDVRTLYDYLFWAHERMVAPLLDLSPEEFTRDLLGNGHRSVRNTLVHMMSSEWIWLSRWHGISPSAMLDPEAFPTLEALETRWGRLRVELQRFVGQVRDMDLPRPFSYQTLQGEEVMAPLVCAMQNFLSHSSHHRGQVALLTRMLGREPLCTDLIAYYLEEESGIARPVRRWEQAIAAGPGERHDRDGEEDEY